MNKTPSQWMHVDAAVVGNRRIHPTTAGIGRAVGPSATILSGANPATYTVSTRRVTLAGAFTGYVAAAGSADLWVAESGTGFDPQRSYRILSNASGLITLAAAANNPNLPPADNTDSVGFIMPFDSAFGVSSVGAAIESIVVTKVDPADATIELRTLESSALLMSIPIVTTQRVPFKIDLSKRGVFFPRGFTANVGPAIAASEIAFDVYYRRVD